MNRVENDAQKISFLWIPLGYVAKWAESPDEVPPWDISRDFPLVSGLDQLHPFDYLGRPGRFSADPEDLEVLRALIRGHVDYSHRAETWEPLSPPAEGYPRLVRADIEHCVVPRNRTNEDVIGDLAPLAKHILAWRSGKPVKALKRRLIELNAKYGAPHGWKGNLNTLEVWLQLAAEVEVHLRAMHEFKTLGYELMLEELKHEYANLERQRVPNKAARARALAEARRKHGTLVVIDPFAHMIADLDRVDWFKQSSIRTLLIAAQEAEGDARLFRKRVADRLYNTISLEVTLSPWGITTHESLSFWAFHKLSQMWRHGVEVKTCEVCGSFFPPTRRDARYCRRGSCADKRYRTSEKGDAARKRRKARATQPRSS